MAERNPVRARRVPGGLQVAWRQRSLGFFPKKITGITTKASGTWEWVEGGIGVAVPQWLHKYFDARWAETAPKPLVWGKAKFGA